ncbi:S16 family serine protease [Streptomyces cremeus]|uniref:S16 family serine protease n=1 Tax=Streptomyces cremeus TaxID=66881 RepID=A0ABV5PGZ4_STRCM
MLPLLSRLSRNSRLALCALPVVALLGVAALAPLPFAVAQPGSATDVLGKDSKGRPVINVTGVPARETEGKLRMTTIVATGPSIDHRFGDLVDAWFRDDRAVMPHSVVYPVGGDDKEISEYNQGEMVKSQNSAVSAALGYLGDKGRGAKVTLNLADIGGPSAGLLFTLGIIDKIDGNGAGGDLTGGLDVAGTGTIEADGTVGQVGGVPLKIKGAKADGATVFLVPKAECEQAASDLPDGMRLVPVSTLDDAVSSLRELAKKDGARKVPSC